MTEDGHSRRTVLGGLTAAAALVASPARLRAADLARHQVGSIELMVASDGSLSVPRSFVLPDTPAAEADALLRASGIVPTPMFVSPTNPVLARTGADLVLVDAGSGANFQPTAGKLTENLERAGIDPASITKVVFTHAHADHLWGAIDDFDEARFPSAAYVIAAAEWDFWTDPETVHRVPNALQGMAAGTARVLKRLEAKIERRGAGDAIAPGMTFIDTAGHTPGHMSVLVESGNERLLIGGDALGHPVISFRCPDWPYGADNDREAGARTRRRLLDQLAADRIPLIGFHLPWPGLGRVARDGTAYRFEAL
jgi:glyoxylase-like metal-dependent hydrolase (beta-lactamase superfamily II)